MVDEYITVTDQVEDVVGVVVDLRKVGLGDRLIRRVLEVRPVDLVQIPETREVERAGQCVDVLL